MSIPTAPPSPTTPAPLRWEIDEPGSWELDAVHFPTPVTRYHQAILREQFPRGFAEGTARTGILLSHFEHRFANGFDYISPRIVGAPPGARRLPPRPVFALALRAHRGMRARLRTARTVLERKPWRADVALWESELKPASTAAHLRLQAFDVTTASDAALAGHLRALRANAEHQYYLHHRFTASVLVPVGDFLVRAGDWTGLPAAELAQACRSSRDGATIGYGHFDAVVAALRADAAARALLGLPPGEVPHRLAAAAGPAGTAARAWLGLVRHRLVTGYDIVDLTAGELPELMVRALVAAVEDRGADRERARAERAHGVRDRVPARHRADFDEALAEAVSIGALREERAQFCDFWAYGLVRRAVLEAGSRLAARDRIEQPADLLDAAHEEMLDLVADTGGPGADELAQRRRWRTTATADLAPARIGPPPAPAPPVSWLPPAVRRMGAAVDAAVAALFVEPEARNEPTTVRGIGASGGCYAGTARVVTGPADFGRIRRGDVLVARATTEAYNTVLPLLGAVVTDRGGLLSHTATVAREYGIPAVVGTREATRFIADGAQVRVDGDAGVVMLP
ncbi:MAG: PEP-utilizing enzyme [Pseudonocardia sp.]